MRTARRKEIANQMNEPLKYKLFSVYGQILNVKTLALAWRHVKENKGAGGVDRISIEDFEKDETGNLEKLLQSLKNRTYTPSPARRVYIPKKNGKKRPLGIPTINDRIVQQALVDRLSPFLEEKVFHDNSCGFRPGRGVELAIKKVLSRLEGGYVYIYDFDIKGCFDHIPHKKLMKVLNKYISDGTVLDIIWKSLKAGYMEGGVTYETESGVGQGACFGPLCANVYLNELDWELDKAGLEFVRYADDSIVMCKTPEDLRKAVKVVGEVLQELGLELSPEKTHEVDFHSQDFEYLGFVFCHLRKSRNDKDQGEEVYLYGPSDKSVKKFKSDLKAKTGKNLSKSFLQWTEELNPVLRGKYNYFQISTRAGKAVMERLALQGRKFHGRTIKPYRALDSYVRQRLRVNFANRGKRHAGIVDGKLHTVKYSNSFFVKTMGLVCGDLMNWRIFFPDKTPDQYLARIKEKPRKLTAKRREFFRYAYAK